MDSRSKWEILDCCDRDYLSIRCLEQEKSSWESCRVSTPEAFSSYSSPLASMSSSSRSVNTSDDRFEDQITEKRDLALGELWFAEADLP